MIALPFILSFCLLALLGWQSILAPQDLPMQDEGAVDHIGMLCAFGQIPLILLGIALRPRRLPAALRIAGLQSACLALVLGLNGIAEAKQRDRVEARIAAGRPFPGGDSAARSFLAGISSATPTVRRFLDRDGDVLTYDIRGLGDVRSIQFDGVDRIGWDIYAVTFEKGTRHIHLYLADDAKLLGIALADAPGGCLSSEIYDCRDS